MTALEIKRNTLLETINTIDDQNLIDRISNYVHKALNKSTKKITYADLTIDPEVLQMLANVHSVGSDINERKEYRDHLERKYQ